MGMVDMGWLTNLISFYKFTQLASQAELDDYFSKELCFSQYLS